MSKGRTTFSARRIRRIRRLLIAKIAAPRPQQKAIREKIRNTGFYISDFRTTSRAFTAEDLDDLIASGAIKIRETRAGALWQRLRRWFLRVIGRP